MWWGEGWEGKETGVTTCARKRIYDKLCRNPLEIIGICVDTHIWTHLYLVPRSRIDLCMLLSRGIDQRTSRFPVISHLTNRILTFGSGVFSCWRTHGLRLIKHCFDTHHGCFEHCWGELAGQWNISSSNAPGCEIDHGHWQLWCLSGCRERDLTRLLSTWNKHRTGG